MNQNYVRKCEEYLQNIPSQKLTAAAAAAAGPNLSSRKLTQKPGPPAIGSLRRGQGRQSINNLPPPVPPPVEGSRPKPRPPVPQTPTSFARKTPLRSPTVGSAGQQQQGSKFIRPCCRPKGAGGRGGGGAAVGRRGSDNVNQNDDDDVRVMDGTVGGGGEGTAERKTKTWDGILAKASAAESVEERLTEIKSKAHSPSPPEPAPITSTFPKGAVPDHPLVPNPSVTSLSTTVTSTSVRPASSSVAAVPPQPRLPSTNTEHIPRKQPSSTSTTAEVPENHHRQLQLQGINLFRFDPLRTLQFLTLELKSKLKPLLTTTTLANDGTSVHKQLYKISKELLYAVKILTENAQSQQQPAASRDKVTSDGKISSKPPICGDSEVSLECQNCPKLQNALDRLREDLPRKEINYLQDPPPQDSSKASTASDQLQLRLEGEIKRLQTMISDKQTAAEGLISDLNRKLDEATHARDEAQRKLLYATLENERLNFLLHSQCSTMANLRNDFSAIQSLADQQIDLLDQTTHGNVDDGLNNPHRSRSKSNTLAFGGNHHRNYRYPSGSGGPSLATASERVVKLRPRQHYSFQNIAEKESDGTNDANDCYSARNSQPQEPEVMLPSSTLVVGRSDAFQKQKNRVMNEEGVEGESGTAEPSGSLSEVNSARSGRFGPTKRALLIDSVRDDSLEKYLEGSQQQQTSSSSSSLSSLTSSQQQQQLQRHRRHERNEPRTTTTTTIGDNRREPPPPAVALGDKPFTTDDDTENFSGYTNNNQHHRHIQNSKTNDCVSLAPGIDGMATNRQQLGPGAGSKKDTLPVLTTTTTTAKGKYPRDYGDKFERRESLLAGAEMEPESGLEEKELCQNRPIMGQIRSVEGSDGKGEEVFLVGKIISDDANEPASGQIRRTTTTTEEFSIDFDDITLPSSPIPFRGQGRDEFPSSASLGDCWM